MRRPLKYHSSKFSNSFGDWDSLLEYSRYLYLRDLEAVGTITDLKRQVRFELLPKQTVTEVVHLKTKDKTVTRTAELPLAYIADFVYYHDGKRVIEDTKGSKTADYIIKRKLMRFFGNPITEITKPRTPVC